MFLQLVKIYPISTLFEHRNKLNLPVSCAVRVPANELTVQGMHHNIGLRHKYAHIKISLHSINTEQNITLPHKHIIGNEIILRALKQITSDSHSLSHPNNQSGKHTYQSPFNVLCFGTFKISSLMWPKKNS